MTTIYSGQRVTVQLNLQTDISTGTPALSMEFLKGDGTTTILKDATLVAGETQIMECTLTGAEATVTAAEDWRVQGLVTETGFPAWRSDTVGFKIKLAFAIP